MNNGGGLFAQGVDEARQRAERIEALLGSIESRLADGIERATEQVAEDQYVWIQGNANSLATTTADVELAAPRPGSAWLVEAIVVTGGVVDDVGGPCAFYFDAIDPGNLVYFFPNAQIESDHAVEIYVPQNRKLIAHFYGQPNNQVCTVNLQVKRLVQEP